MLTKHLYLILFISSLFFWTSCNHDKLPTPSEVFQVVENMPMPFSAECQDLEPENDVRDCAMAYLLERFYQELEYPEEALQQGITGTVVIRFIVETDGTMSNFLVTRDIGGGCGKESIRAIKALQDQGFTWLPGSVRGELVRVYFNLPVKFR